MVYKIFLKNVAAYKVGGREVNPPPAAGDYHLFFKLLLKKSGFALIEILIAITILSISLISIISGVSAGIIAISGNKNLTRAMIIAKNKLNEFEMNNMRGPDIESEEVEEYNGFTYSREVKRFEHELLGPLDANRVVITVKWQEKGADKNYSLTYIYPVK